MAAERGELSIDESAGITQAALNASQAFRRVLTTFERHGELEIAELLHWHWDRMLADLQSVLSDW